MSVEKKFKDFLFPKLKIMEFDEDVFGNYILGILMTEEPMSDKKESLLEFFTSAAEQDMSAFCDEICNEWSTVQKSFSEETVVEEVDFSLRLANIMQNQVKSVAKVNSPAETEKKFKDAILAQYSEISDDEAEDDQGYIIHKSSSKSGAVASHTRNVNVQAVIDAEKDQREKSKLEYEKKKTQDKLNREKQKEKQQERKEKERKRIQKTEHRR